MQKSKRKTPQAENKALWLEKTLCNLSDCISDGIYCLDTSGRFIFVNNSIVERSSIPLERLYGAHFLDVVQPEYHRVARENFERVMNGKNGTPYELSYKRPDGHLHMIEVQSRPIRDGEKIVGLLGIARNITDRKVAEQALKASEINLSKLVREKTAEFLEKNMRMEMELKERKRTESQLRKRIRELKAALSIHLRTTETCTSSDKCHTDKTK
ncbi:MAG: PAS domain S-box protein [Syntrophales bacterium]